MYIINHAAVVTYLFGFAASTTTKICPILGPSFPKPSGIGSFSAFTGATKALDAAIDAALQSGEAAYGPAPFNTSTFSIGVLSAGDDGLSYQRHFTDPIVANSSVGVNHADANTVYRIGSASKAFTVLTFLSKIGYRRWYDPITLYLPKELFVPNERDNLSTGALPQWSDITVGDLASQISGLLRDYGLGDSSYPFPTLGATQLKGVPPLPSSEIPVCGYNDIEDRFHDCTAEELMKGLSTQPAAFAAGHTPSYSNSAYDLLALIAENITGMPMSQMFNEVIVQPLGLHGTFYDAPVEPSLGAIPVNTTISGWDAPLGVIAPSGANFASTNDLAAIGKAIMNNTFLSKPDTRRWLKPVSFQGVSNAAVGAPWEITRWQTPNRVFDIYAKDGEVGFYATLFILIPDLNFGVSILEANAVDTDGLSPVKYGLANLAIAHLLPVVEDIARQQAATNFAGTYRGDSNSSFALDIDDQPGLFISGWNNNGTDLLAQLSSIPHSARLWPNELYDRRSCQVGFSAVFSSVSESAGETTPLNECFSWGRVDTPTYGNVGLGNVVFNLDTKSGKATSVRLEGLRTTLERVE